MAGRRRFLAGFGGFVWGEALPWLGWRGLVRLVVWTGLVNGLLYLSIATSWDPGWITFESLDEVIDWTWLFASIGAIAVTLGPVVGERRRGTTAWVVSKPVSRGTYVLGKIVVHGLGVAISMIYVPGLIAYWWLPNAEHARGFVPPQPGMGRFLLALSVLALVCTFLVALVVMLGMLLRLRSLVTGISLIVLILTYAPITNLGWSKFQPGMLINWQRPTELTPLSDFVFGAPLSPPEALWVTVAAIVAFTIVALISFRRAEL